MIKDLRRTINSPRGFSSPQRFLRWSWGVIPEVPLLKFYGVERTGEINFHGGSMREALAVRAENENLR
ncbi:hypothetical protein X777_02778 [Ooceraea biroi]|uniref:Uncharacterized protein n=1 Tax=Ooceraea biroi TaxID=2015173 RepID=A0A026WLK0_OOCBI|nr:hypothetical protein X777_02778 [Ooceraea biroi]